MTHADEETLIASCLRNDSGAWELLYRTYAGRIRSVIGWSRWGFSKNEVDDFVQEVFLELVRSLGSFRGESNLNTFVMRLARNKCVSHLRRVTAQKRGRESLAFSVEETRDRESTTLRALAVDGNPTPDNLIVADEEARALLEGLSKLSGDCQEIIRLRYYQEMAYEEICQKLELPLGTVCSRLKRCLDKLKSVVQSGIT